MKLISGLPWLTNIITGMLVGYVFLSSWRRGHRMWSLVITSLLVYLGLTLVGTVRADVTSPPLPSVTFPASGIDSKRILKLLSHTDGYWYVLDESNGNVVAIPDNEAGTVTLSR